MNLVNHAALLIEPVRGADQQRALELLFADLSPARRAECVAALRAPCANGPIAGLWAAYRDGHLLGVLRVEVQGGTTAFVTLGCVSPEEPPQVAQELLSRVLDALRAQGVLVAQTLLETDHGPAAERLVAGGFRHVANLLYLVSSREAFPDGPGAETLEYVPCTAERYDTFAAIVERTYAGSLDCIGMDAVRTVHDVLGGYRSAGSADSARWLTVRSDGEAIGCLLVNDDSAGGQTELVYLGVVPEARGRGLGLAMTRHAQWLAHVAGRSRVVLAVDAANAPAIRVYAAAGFVTWDHRSVFLRVI